MDFQVARVMHATESNSDRIEIIFGSFMILMLEMKRNDSLSIHVLLFTNISQFRKYFQFHLPSFEHRAAHHCRFSIAIPINDVIRYDRILLANQ